MGKASTRFRNRKINFKTRITVRTGNHALDFEEDGPILGEGEIEFEEDGKDGKSGGNGVDTGVDKEEEGEIHLQAVLASSNASVSRGATSGGSNTRGSLSAASPAKPQAKAYIPTPDSTGTIESSLFDRLYPPNSYVDPISYIRFSDTVEDAQIGATGYTMDEDDEDWLEAYNAQFAMDGKLVDGTTQTSPTGTAVGAGRSGRDRKGKGEKGKGEKGEGGSSSAAPGPLGDDEFEAILELFEKVTEDKAPMAHVVSLVVLVPVRMILMRFVGYICSTNTGRHGACIQRLPKACTCSAPQLRSIVVSALEGATTEARRKEHHPSTRREFPSPLLSLYSELTQYTLQYDESDEQNPYVCFRRRELKSSRKTRRSDAQNIERLIRLRNDLYAAHALMLKTLDRERMKLEAIQLDRKILEGRIETRDCKRRLGEVDGDEDILIGRREKRRRRDDQPQSAGYVPNSILSSVLILTPSRPTVLSDSISASPTLRSLPPLSSSRHKTSRLARTAPPRSTSASSATCSRSASLTSRGRTGETVHTSPVSLRSPPASGAPSSPSPDRSRSTTRRTRSRRSGSRQRTNPRWAWCERASVVV